MDKLTVRAILEKHPVYVESSDFITRTRQLIRDFHHRILSGRMLMEGFEWYLVNGSTTDCKNRKLYFTYSQKFKLLRLTGYFK